MQKKSTTKSKIKSRAELRAKLARDISSILTNPETPVGLYNAVGEEVCDWSSDYCNQNRETLAYIQQCLESHLKAEAERKGGAR